MNRKIHSRFSAEIKSDSNLRAFAFFSANLQKLMPEIPFDEHPRHFLEADRYGKLAGNSELNHRWASACAIPARCPEEWHEPGIVATFHTGPYRLVGMWLAKQGIPLTLVVSADVAREQQNSYRASYEQLADSRQVDGYECLIAEDPMILRKMTRALQRGRFLLVYVDGHMGVGKNPGSRTTHTVDFLAHQLRVKTGVAELARMARVPIYPVLARFDLQDRPVLEYFPTLTPAVECSGKATTVKKCMDTLYSYLAGFVKQYPMQWEGWFYAHHDLVRQLDGHHGGLFRYYMPFELAGRCFLLHKESFMVYPVSERLYQKLKKKV